jgi:hypothetical protein
MFLPRTCGFCRDVATVAAALISYVDVGLLLGRTRGGCDRDRLLPLHRCVTTLATAPTLLLHYTSSGNDPWSPIQKLPRWHGESSVSVAYPFSYSMPLMSTRVLRWARRSSGSSTSLLALWRVPVGVGSYVNTAGDDRLLCHSCIVVYR